MMLLRFRLSYIYYCVLFSSALGTVQMMTPTAYGRDPESCATADKTCSTQGNDEIKDVAALSCVLAKIPKILDKKEENFNKQGRKIGIHANIDRRAPMEFDEVELRTVADALNQLGLGQRRNDKRVIPNLDYFLVRAHIKYKDLKEKYKDLKKIYYPDKLRQYRRHLDDIDDNIHSLLMRRGLHRPMSAVVRGGVTLVDVANDRKVLSESLLAPLPNAVNILLGTKHWKDEEPFFNLFDFSITGQIGIVPILAAYRSAKDTDKNDGKMCDSNRQNSGMTCGVYALYQSGIIYEAHVNAHVSQLSNSEVSFFSGVGQTRLWDRDANVESEQLPSTLNLVKNGPGLSAYRFEWGVEYKLYTQEMDIVHHDKSLLSPVFNLAVGRRLDERLRAWADFELADSGRPWRNFARLGFDLRQVFGQRKVEDKGKINIFGIRIVAEREWGGIFPTANRLLLEADVDLGKLLMGNRISN